MSIMRALLYFVFFWGEGDFRRVPSVMAAPRDVTTKTMRAGARWSTTCNYNHVMVALKFVVPPAVRCGWLQCVVVARRSSALPSTPVYLPRLPGCLSSVFVDKEEKCVVKCIGGVLGHTISRKPGIQMLAVAAESFILLNKWHFFLCEDMYVLSWCAL